MPHEDTKPWHIPAELTTGMQTLREGSGCMGQGKGRNTHVVWAQPDPAMFLLYLWTVRCVETEPTVSP